MDRNVARNEMAKGVLDIACHELAARQVGRPVHDLIGGAAIDRIPLCGLIPLGDPDTTAGLAHGYQRAGYGTVRIKLGTGPIADRDAIAEVRARCGDELRVRVDYNQAYTAPVAARALALLEPFGIDAAEQPLPVGDLAAMPGLQQRTSIPLFLHEGFFSVADAVLLLPSAPGIAPMRGSPPAILDDLRARGLSILCIAGLARLPQINLPLATLEGCPLGLSLVAARGNDTMLLALARELL